MWFCLREDGCWALPSAAQSSPALQSPRGGIRSSSQSIWTTWPTVCWVLRPDTTRHNTVGRYRDSQDHTAPWGHGEHTPTRVQLEGDLGESRVAEQEAEHRHPDHQSPSLPCFCPLSQTADLDPSDQSGGWVSRRKGHCGAMARRACSGPTTLPKGTRSCVLGH